MSEHISDEQLNDFVDGLLSPREVRVVERYLTASPEARREVEFLRDLKARTARLPESIEPPRDLWPQIAEKMAPAPLVPVAPTSAADRPSVSPWRLGAPQWGALAAAAMILVVASSSITAWMVATPALTDGGDSAQGPAPIAAAMEDVRPIDGTYALQIEELLWVLYENRDVLDADTVSTIETNLRVIDRAIASAREALEEDPQNAGLSRMLTSNYRHKVKLLERANRIIERSG